MDTSLELLKACRLALFVQRDDLAIEDDRGAERSAPLFQRRDDLRKLRCLLVAEPRPQADRVPDLPDRADAVVFGLVDEVRIVERSLDNRGQHGGEHFRLQNSDFRLKELTN